MYETIDIGNTASNRNSTAGNDYTYLDYLNAANAAGILNSFSIYINTAPSGTYYLGTFNKISTNVWSNRDSEAVTSSGTGLKTFTGKNCDVGTNDALGYYLGTGGVVEADYDSGGGIGLACRKSGNQFGQSNVTYDAETTKLIYSIYASGITVPDPATNVSATDNLTDKSTITWTPGTGETGGHRVYRDGVDISGVVAHGTSTYDDTTGTAGTTYSYTVKAINDAGLSAASSADNGMRLAASSFIPRIMFF